MAARSRRDSSSHPAGDGSPHLLEVHAKPGARHEGIRLLPDGIVEVRVRERAVEGRANDAIIEAIASALGISRSRVRLAGGAHGRRKRLALRDMDPSTARRILGGGRNGG